ncbi:hypothetical protein [Evansella tamaricis]|uniref:Uncharacterized protein n=1 Tax=Evansella tamaricis TaxID=2069301 RepID=A0ABS6JHH4_9BACI|nr:hypothetical protein [Evansella tamaricis]MBU9713114.1 hypothetical protein [Evansella tamaricis]
MITIGDYVIVNKQGYTGYVGKGKVIDICKDFKDMEQYFSEDHPYYSIYVSWIQNNREIYIVDLDGNLGKAGFFIKELTKG